jgi:cell division protein FtsQ
MARASKTTVSVRRGFRWKLFLGIAAAGLVFASSCMAALKLHDYLIRDPQFSLYREKQDALTLEGVRYASRSKVLRVFAQDFERSVFALPLAERRRRLLAIDWVEDASVSRFWPGRVVVRIRERRPVAFVFLPPGIWLIDAQGVLLEPPAEASFSFPVLSGVRDEESETQRRQKVSALLRLEQDLGPLAKDISEVNAADPEDLRMIVQIDNRALELMLGDDSYARRYRNFLTHYSDIKRSSPEVKSFDLRLDDRITAKGISAPWQ